MEPALQKSPLTGLDYFGARYFSGAQGRFTSPDAPLLDQDPSDPQSWNLYSYVRNNPLIFTDPTGNDCVYVNSSGNGIDSINNQNTSKDCGKTGGYWVDGTVTNARFAHGSLILTGTTNGENRTSASYALGPDPGLMALKEAGNRAARDITTFAVAEAVFATAYVSTYAGPALYAALAAGGEAGVLTFGSKAFEIVRDATGKVHGELPKFIPKNVTREQLELAAQELRASIQVRQQAMLRLGEQGNHGLRIAKEQQLLYRVEQRLGKR
jgi:RHS repeat-associated protein